MRARLTLLALLVTAACTEEEPVANRFERTSEEIEQRAKQIEAEVENDVGAVERQMQNEIDALANQTETNEVLSNTAAD